MSAVAVAAVPTAPNAPVVLDLDGSVGALPHEQRLPLGDWQEAVRFGCGLSRFKAFRQLLQARMPAPAQHGTVLMGSGDFHHLSWPLIERCIAAQAFSAQRPLRVVVLDNHPDNMRFPFGIHCGSWVRRVAQLPQVSHVHVAGITSGDVGAGHSWENHLAPLFAGKLTYWTTGVATGWARWLGLGSAFRAFGDAQQLADALADFLRCEPQPTYLSIDKDVFAPAVVRTNWDQGQMLESHADAVIDALRGQLVASDITGDVSAHVYTTPWKRWLSGHDGQDTTQTTSLAQWQAGQHALNLKLLARLESCRRAEQRTDL